MVPRLSGALNFPPTGEVWLDASLATVNSRTYRNILTGRQSPRYSFPCCLAGCPSEYFCGNKKEAGDRPAFFLVDGALVGS